MAEKIVSPGVFTKEVDQTFLPAAIAEIGAAIIGPTVKGPALVPTVVSSYSEFQQRFGDSFKSGSQYYQYLTSHTAENYLKHSDKLTVVRILDSSYSSANITHSSEQVTTGANTASGSLLMDPSSSADRPGKNLLNEQVTIGGVDFVAVTEPKNFNNSATELYWATGSTSQSAMLNLAGAIGSSSLHGLNITASFNEASGALFFTATSTGTDGNLSAASSSNAFYFPKAFHPSRGGDGVATTPFVGGLAVGSDGSKKTGSANAQEGGTDTSTEGNSFKLYTLADGAILNNADSTARKNNILVSGSQHNLRYEVTGVNKKKGTFSLLIRRGDDSIKRKQILETWNNLSMDPNAKNFAPKLIGDQVMVTRDIGTTDPFIQLSGSYTNKSKYVRIEILSPTDDYLDENGEVRVPDYSASLPQSGSGSSGGGFSGGDNGYAGFDAVGKFQGSGNVNKCTFYDKIADENTQCFHPDNTTTADGGQAYYGALNLLKNQDEYDINLVLMPGLNQQYHAPIISKAIDVCEERGDCFVVADPVPYASTITQATTEAEDYDSNYAAMYWPWVQVPDNQVGTNRWVPPSVVIPGIFAFNDKVAHPWFAPAGLNRGGIETAIQAERKLTHANRDTLYESSVNPIATFPGQGVTVWGQKTLQKKASSLDRINVRRLLIKLKKFIASSSRFLVFEQNNSSTRRRFLAIVNPYLEQVQSNSGLTAFRVVMDDTNNTPDVVDRNILYGQIFIQPTRTAEFIVLDFTVQPTGATFPE